MKKFKKSVFVIFILLIIIFSVPLSVSANAPAPADHLTVILSNLPDNAVYADLLVKISKDDSNFVDISPNGYDKSVSKSSEIVAYSDDGYYSFTFHYKNSKSDMKIEEYYEDLVCVEFCKGLEYEEFLTQYESLLNNYRDIKIALLDKDFNIITVSQAAKLPENDSLYSFYGEIYYDFESNALEVDADFNYSFIVFGGIFLIAIMFMSIVSETLASLLFGFKGKQLLTIIFINLCSQIVMRLLYFILPFTYLIETVVLEILVYVTEFVIYKKYFKEESTAKIVGYTVIANTLSLLLGINFYNYFWA